MTWIQVIVLAIVQGLSEFLPISSSGHLVLVPSFFGWTDQGLAFDVAVHFGSLLAVCAYFREDIAALDLPADLVVTAPVAASADLSSLDPDFAAWLDGFVAGQRVLFFGEGHWNQGVNRIFLRVVEQVRDRLGATPVPMQMNIGAEEEFRGVVDLVKMKAIYWKDENMGIEFEEHDIPEELVDTCNDLRERMIEAAAEANEELMEKYLEEGELSADEIKAGIRARTLANEITPMFCGSAFKNKGVQAVLDAVIDYMPAPADVPSIKGHLDDADETLAERHPSDDEPFAALAFKIATDPFVGTLTFIRVYSGVLKSGDSIMNPVKGKKERVGRILQMHANSREEIKEVRAGDIAALVGLKDVTTGETLCDINNVIILEKMDFPEPVISVAVEPRTKADQEKMGIALQKLAQEDPSFRVHTDEESGQTIISGMGELHLEIIVDRMKREFHVEANVGNPQVAYRETIRQAV